MGQYTVPLLRLGFRPFFLLAGLFAVILLALWLLFWQQENLLTHYYSKSLWHAHEMLFGFVTAVIAGFLLTAVRNWSGNETPTGIPLAILAGIWLLGRLLPLVSLSPDWLTALADLCFLPLLAGYLARPLWSDKNRNNRYFLLLLLVMFFANLSVHLEVLGFFQSASAGIRLMLGLVVLLILIISGRVMPFFTQAVVPGYRAKQRVWLERTTILAMILIICMSLLEFSSWPSLVIYIMMSVLQMIRMAGWFHRDVWRIPVLLVLYSGYMWVIAGFLFSGLAAVNIFPDNFSLHMLAVGVIGVFTLGMMSRVTLGHTGRPMRTGTATNIAFVLVNLAVVVRTLFPALMPSHYMEWVYLSGVLWIIAFLVFCIVFVPYLLKARVDQAYG